MPSSPPAVSIRIRPDGKLVSDREIRNGLRLGILASSLGTAWSVSLNMPLQMLLEKLGATGTALGLATTIQLLSMVMQIPGAIMTERSSSRRSFFVANVTTHRALWLIIAITPLIFYKTPSIAVVIVIACLALSSLFQQFGTAAWGSWMADMVPEHSRSSFWAKRQGATMFAFLLALGLSGIVLDRFRDNPYNLGFTVVLGVAAILGISDIILHLFIPELKAKPAAISGFKWRRVTALFTNPDFLWFTLASAIWSFSIGLFGSFSNVYLKREFPLITYTNLSVIAICSSIGTLFSSFFAGYLIKRVGARTFGVIILALTPLHIIPWFFLDHGTISMNLPFYGELCLPTPTVLLGLNNLLGGMTYGGVGLVLLNMQATNTPKEGRTLALAVHSTTVGMIAAMAPIIGGFFMDWYDQVAFNSIIPLCSADATFSYKAAYYLHITANWLGGYFMPVGTRVSAVHLQMLAHMIIVWGIGVGVMLKIRRQKDLDVGSAIHRLMFINPFRAVISIYNIYTVTSPKSEDDNVQAVHQLGDSRTALASEDLIQNLDDPSYEVREAAILALGRIGSPEAINAIRLRLKQPSDLTALAAHALRLAKGREAVPDLQTVVRNYLQKPDFVDRETCCECIRALGVCNAINSKDLLIEVLSTTADEKILASAAGSLSQLKVYGWESVLLKRWSEVQTPIIRQSLILILGNSYGTRNEFYVLFKKELTTAGSQTRRIIKRLKRSIRQYPDQKIPATQQALEILGQLEQDFEHKKTHAALQKIDKFVALMDPDNLCASITSRIVRINEIAQDSPDEIGFALLALFIVAITWNVN